MPAVSTDGTWAIIVSVVIFIILVAVLFAVIVRKRAYAKTWFPEGLCVLSGFGDQRPRTNGQASAMSDERMSDSFTTTSETYNDEDSCQKKPRHGRQSSSGRSDTVDRIWPTADFSANHHTMTQLGSKVTQPSFDALMPPQGPHSIVNCYGPGGVTPLMVAAMSPGPEMMMESQPSNNMLFCRLFTNHVMACMNMKGTGEKFAFGRTTAMKAVSGKYC